jgi:hypothetical protein
MAEHRRVEPRNIVGTGMTADPERIRDIEDEHERRARAWREAPERGFGDVLEKAPAKGELIDEDAEDPRKRKRKDVTAAPGEPSAPAPVQLDAPAPASAAPAPSKPLPRVPPDPRERALRAKLAQNLAQPKLATSGDTPPTGSVKRTP